MRIFLPLFLLRSSNVPHINGLTRVHQFSYYYDNWKSFTAHAPVVKSALTLATTRHISTHCSPCSLSSPSTWVRTPFNVKLHTHEPEQESFAFTWSVFLTLSLALPFSTHSLARVWGLILPLPLEFPNPRSTFQQVPRIGPGRIFFANQTQCYRRLEWFGLCCGLKKLFKCFKAVVKTCSHEA